MLRRMILSLVGIDWSAPWHVILHSWHARIDIVVYITLHFCHGQRWSQLSIRNLLHTSKRCFCKDGCDAVWSGGHPTAGDVADLLLLGMRKYVLFSAGNNSVVGKKHRLKPGIVSNQSSWPSLRVRSDGISSCIMLLAP